MTDYPALKAECVKHREMSKVVIDDFLLYYAAGHHHLEREMEQKLGAYRHVTKTHPQSWLNSLKAQYIIHRVFKENGLISKFLNHRAIQALRADQRSFLEQQAAHPWKFSFSVIIENPAEDFYLMEDVFREERFLLYSPGATRTLSEQGVMLWLNLIAYNGVCWQSFGPISGYQSFDQDDIFFFASEVSDDIESNADVVESVERTPVPYMMLLSGARIPRTMTRGHETIHLYAEHNVADFDVQQAEKIFETTLKYGVYELQKMKLSDFPHFANGYYNTVTCTLSLSAMTDHGFLEMAKILIKCGYAISTEPDVRVHIGMLVAMKEILRKDIKINPYEDLFVSNPQEENSEELDLLNQVVALVIEEINDNQDPDPEALAKTAGMDVNGVREIIRKIKASLERTRDEISRGGYK